MPFFVATRNLIQAVWWGGAAAAAADDLRRASWGRRRGRRRREEENARSCLSSVESPRFGGKVKRLPKNQKTKTSTHTALIFCAKEEMNG